MLKPNDCNFMFCLPLTVAEFQSDRYNLLKHFVREHLPKNKSKASQIGQLWDVYSAEVINPYLKLKDQFSEYGFVFNDAVSSEDFIRMIQRYKVNIIFSHCKTGDNEAIEFFDKLVSVREFVNAVPLDFDKVIDLSVCNPRETASLLREERKMAVVKSSNKSISFIYWLYFYALVFEIILKYRVEYYSTALELAISKLYSR